MQRLQAARLRQSPSEVGLAQVKEELEVVKNERDHLRTKCAQQEIAIAHLTDEVRGIRLHDQASLDDAPARKRKRNTKPQE